MRRGLIIGALISLATAMAPAVLAQPLQTLSATAEIAGWNLSGFSAIPADRARRQADAIALLDAEVLVLAGVRPDTVAGDIVQRLNNLGACYDHVILNQSAIQNIAVLFKCAVQVTNPRFVAGSDDNNSGLRRALAADVELGEFDFLLTGVHMKAG